MIVVLGIALAAAIGAPVRFVIERRITDPLDLDAFPWGLVVVNVTGSALAGIVAATTTGDLRTVLLVGLCGAYTTFSGFAMSALRLARRHAMLATAYLAMSLLGSVGAFLVARAAFA
jgi:CrcB protein